MFGRIAGIRIPAWSGELSDLAKKIRRPAVCPTVTATLMAKSNRTEVEGSNGTGQQTGAMVTAGGFTLNGLSLGHFYYSWYVLRRGKKSAFIQDQNT